MIRINSAPKIRQFKCIALNRRNKKIKLNLVAKNKNEAIQKIYSMSLKPVKIIDKTPTFLIGDLKAKDSELALFFYKLKDYIDNSFELTTSIENFLNESFSYKFKLFLYELSLYLKEGYSFADALKKTKMVDNVFIKMVEIGEVSSKLSEMLGKIADILEKKSILKKKLIKSMIKPILTLLFAFGIMIFVLPVLIKPVKDIFSSLGTGKIPLITKIVISFQDYISNYYLYFILSIFFIITAFIYFYINNKKFRQGIDKFLLKIPFLGDLILYYNLYLSLITLQTYIESGQSFVNAFKEIANSLKNKELEDEFNFLYQRGREGYSLKDIVVDMVYIPPLYKDMLISADIKGTLAIDIKELIKLAYKDFNEKSDKFISVMSSFIGLIVMIIVGIIIFAVYMPMFSVVGAINEGIINQ